jgi:hypothetical protein
VSEQKPSERPVDEPLPDRDRSPLFQGLCSICGKVIERPARLCDDHADLVEERAAAAVVEVYDFEGNHLGDVQVGP